MQPKVVHVVTHLFNGGTEQGILTLAQAGFYNSMDLHIIELSKGRGAIRDKIIETVGEDHVISLTEHAPGYRLSRKDGPGLIKKLYHTFGALKPDTAVLSLVEPKIYGRLAALPYPHMKVVSFEHDSKRGNFPTELALRLTSLRSDVTFGDTQETIAQRSFSYFGAQTSFVVPLAILEASEPRNDNVPEVIKILSLGRLVEQKNYGELIQAATQLIKEGHNIELTITGDGRQREMLENMISTLDQETPGLGIVQRIRLPHFVSDQDALKEARANAHIYVQCSLHEGFCIATAEALAAGLPTATTDFSGMRDYGNDKNILRIAGTTQSHIADSLRYMIVNYGRLAPVMSRAAIETAQQKFGHATIMSQWNPAMQEVMKPRVANPQLPGRYTYIPGMMPTHVPI